VSEPDRGQSHALNKALAMSRGEIIGWVNSDDAYFVRDAVHTAVEHFSRSPDLGVVFGDAMMIDETNCVIRHHRCSLPHWQSLAPLFSPISQPAALIRRESLGANGDFLREDLEVTLDLELWLRLHNAGVRFHHIPKPVAVDRDHESRKVRNLQAKAHFEDTILASEYGLTFRYSFLDRLRSWRRRLAGLPEFWGAHNRNDLAIQISMPPLFPLLLNQLLLPHSMQRTLNHRKHVLAK
jgi:cellulose synthase/poly-beta-1,6-N-acetylglucosamine synthase-like glycosyltransferase